MFFNIIFQKCIQKQIIISRETGKPTPDAFKVDRTKLGKHCSFSKMHEGFGTFADSYPASVLQLNDSGIQGNQGLKSFLILFEIGRLLH